ncbi:MAG: ABC transporter substrate-binding protein [Acetobacter papayae]|uniref:ABC transporter substrate-binding protein n=1 Tax=Acetobacter papayae TaxID=1076592 RepID=UPI0039EBEA3C
MKQNTRDFSPAVRRVRRRGVGLLVAAGLCLSAFGAVRAQAEPELIVADQKGQQKALMEAAGVDHTTGYHIRWVEFDAAAPLLQALGAGAVDTGIVGDGPFVFAWGAGLDVKAVWRVPQHQPGRATAVIAADGSPITTPAQLSGKRIATGRGSIGHLLLLRLLATGAIPAPAPELVFLLPVQAKAALDTGRVDAWSTWEPYVSLAVVAGHAHVVADAQGLMPNDVFFVASSTALAEKSAQLVDFYHRVTDAYKWGIGHKADYVQLFARQTGMPEPVAAAAADKLMATPGPVTAQTVKAEEAVAEAYRAAGMLARADGFQGAFVQDFSGP